MDFAVIKLNGKQFIVKKGDLLTVDRVSLETPVQVLAFATDSSVELDLEKLTKIGLELEVMSDFRTAKIQVRRYKSKSRYRKNKTHRQPLTMLKVIDLSPKGGIKIVENKGKTEKPTEEQK
ncbi:MAG: large subunit ribosomal protein, partial [Patescibacteria group bacterium]|nr:large subunit ribosomal protein [Patescibacteria group bacterium]